MAWVLDLDGVVWLGDQPIRGAVDAIAALRRRGEQVAFITNNSAVPRSAVEAKLRGFGIDPQDGVVTSAMAGATLVEPGMTALLCGGPGIAEELEARGVRVVRDGDADVVVVGFHRDFDYERMRIASAAVRNGARLIATNDDATYPTPDGLTPGAGSILASIATASGVTPVVAGKPYPAMVELVRARVDPTGVGVGDRPDTDGRFARALGFRWALVLSGVTLASDLPVDPEPDLVAADLATLVERTADEGPS